MKVTTENMENKNIALTITLDEKDWQKAIAKGYQRVASKVNIPGFRKGKAPKHILEKQVGMEYILEEAYEIVAPTAFQEALKKESLELGAYPSFEKVTLLKDEPLVFKAVVTPKPQVTLGEYKDLHIEKKEVAISDEEVDAQLKKMQNMKATMEEAKEGAKAEMGDFVTLDFQGSVDGEPFEGGEGKDYLLELGSNTFIKGFEDQLVGTTVGEERDVHVTFPLDYHKNTLAGKNALFKTKVSSIKNKVLPAIDDEFATKVSPFKTVAELKEDIKNRLQEIEEKKALTEYQTKVVELAADNATMDIPPAMIEERIDLMVQELSLRLESQGIRFDQYLHFLSKDMDKLREEYRPVAERNVRIDLMLEEVAKKANITVTNRDMDNQVAEMALQYNATTKDVRNIIKEQGRVGSLYTTVLRKKTARFIVDNAK